MSLQETATVITHRSEFTAAICYHVIIYHAVCLGRTDLRSINNYFLFYIWAGSDEIFYSYYIFLFYSLYADDQRLISTKEWQMDNSL